MKTITVKLTKEEAETVRDALASMGIDYMQTIYKAKSIMDKTGWTETGREWVESQEEKKSEVDRLIKVFSKTGKEQGK